VSRGIGGAKYWGLLEMRGAGSFGNEIAITGRKFTAEEAKAAGVIDRLVPRGKHLEAAYELARQINSNPPLSVRSTVRARRWKMMQIGQELERMSEPYRLYLTEDFQEAATAFKEKREPRPFQGR
jgi:enoyl-CoA hydratase/carnithine racemase